MMIKNYDKSEEFILHANLVIYHCKDEKQLSLLKLSFNSHSYKHIVNQLRYKILACENNFSERSY